MGEFCLQETYSPLGECFGCGPYNERGLRVRSIPRGDEVVAQWEPEKHHASKGSDALSSGIVGTLLDCHSNWAAAWHLMQKTGASRPPCVVTSEYSVRHLSPASSKQKCWMTARIVHAGERWAKVEAHLESNGKVCAVARGTFVVVEEGQPGFHAW
jgi:acyl-coenzyme A thioesterase PaaI-like protein